MRHRNNGAIVHAATSERNHFGHLFTRPKREQHTPVPIAVVTIAPWPRTHESTHRAAPAGLEPTPVRWSATPPTRSSLRPAA
jgi:hypothetical protein